MEQPPLSTIEIVPFNFFDPPSDDPSVPVEPNFEIATRENLELLKDKTNKYIDTLHGMLFDIFNKHPNEYVVYYSYVKEKEERDRRMVPESNSNNNAEGHLPTAIQFQHALDNASYIIEEVERTRRENQSRMNLFPKPATSPSSSNSGNSKTKSLSRVRVDPILFSSKSPESRTLSVSPASASTSASVLQPNSPSSTTPQPAPRTGTLLYNV